MIISSKTNFGIKLLLDITLYSDMIKLTFEELKKRTGLSDKYLSYLLEEFLRSGVISDGRNGNEVYYKLAKEPQEIYIEELFEILDDNFKPFSYADESGEYDFLIKEMILDKIDKAVRREIKGKNLKELSEKFRDIQTQLFYI